MKYNKMEKREFISSENEKIGFTKGIKGINENLKRSLSTSILFYFTFVK